MRAVTGGEFLRTLPRFCDGMPLRQISDDTHLHVGRADDIQIEGRRLEFLMGLLVNRQPLQIPFPVEDLIGPQHILCNGNPVVGPFPVVGGKVRTLLSIDIKIPSQ